MPARSLHTTRRPGGVMAEAALTLPVFFLILFGIFEYGRLFLVRNVVAAAAREGARYAIVNTASATTADVQNKVLGVLGSQQAQLKNLTIQVYATDGNGNPLSGTAWNSAGFGNGIGVQVDGDFTPALPTFLLMPSLIHLRTAAVMNSEAN